MRVVMKRTPKGKAMCHTLILSAAGLASGVIIKLLDIYTSNLGNLFSRMSVWIFLCVLISAYSSTPKRAAVNVFVFCAGMLLTYYLTAELTQSPYSFAFIVGWTVFSLFSPLMAYLTWFARGQGVFAWILTVGIVVVMLIIAVVLFDKIRITDVALAAVTVIALLKKG